MRRDPTQFRERFKRWKAGELVYDKGFPKFEGGKDGNVTKVYLTYYDEDGNLVTNVDAQLPEIVVEGSRTNYNLIAAAERERQRNIARHYLEKPTLPNLVNAAGAFWNSLPINTTAETVNPNISTGVAPIPDYVGKVPKAKKIYETGRDVVEALESILKKSAIGRAIGGVVKPVVNTTFRFGESIPVLKYKMVDLFPLHYGAKQYNIKSLPNGLGEKLKEFYSKDVYPRYTVLPKYNKILTPEQLRVLGRRGDILDDMTFILYQNPYGKLDGFVNNNPNTVYINTSRLNDKELFGVLAHESEHIHRGLLRNNLNMFGVTGHSIMHPFSGYSDAEIKALKRGYQFDIPFIRDNKKFMSTEKRTSEMSAENRRHRAELFYNTGLVGGQMDNYIDGLSEEQLIGLMRSGYGRSFQRTSKTDQTLYKNMKNAMKIVPALSFPLIFNNQYAE